MASSTLSTVALLACVFILYRTTTNFFARRRFSKFAKQYGCEEPHDATPPFPWGWRFLWRLIRSKKTGEDVLDDIIAEDFVSHHTVKKTAADGNVMLMTCDPTNLQAILANQFSDFETGPLRHAVFFPLLGNSIFSSDGAIWKHSRALLRPTFSRDNINNLDATAHAADALIRSLGEPDSKTAWTPEQDVLPLFFHFTLDTATEFLFGESTGTLTAFEKAKTKTTSPPGSGGDSGKQSSDSATVAASSEFADALRVANEYTLLRIRIGRFYWLGDGLRFRRSIRTVKGFVEGFVDKALARVEAEGKVVEGKEEHGLLETLAAQTKDRGDLVSQTLAVMIAGRDTTAALLGWCLLRLTLHPEIFTSLRETCLRDFPSDTQPDFAQLKSCRPMQHFLQEVLRLHATVPVNNRICVKDTTLPLGGGADQNSPIAVRAGQIVTFSVYFMHRRKDLWGEDALEFRPSRWEEGVRAWQWLPFLGGPRVCLGQQFALTEAGFLLVRLLREFDAVKAVDEVGMRRMKKGVGLTLWPADGVRVRFHKASL